MNSYIITNSRVKFQFLDPQPETIKIEDIAHALSLICRFTGHVQNLYSVCQHAILVSQCVSPENALWGLLHDAPEAYVNDLSSPLKHIIDGRYAFIEQHIMWAICRKFGLSLAQPEEVRRFDRIITVNELWDLVDPSYVEDGIPRIFQDPIQPWTSVDAEKRFLDRYEELRVK